MTDFHLTFKNDTVTKTSGCETLTFVLRFHEHRLFEVADGNYEQCRGQND